MLIDLPALNLLFGTLAAILLIFSELFKIRSQTLHLRIDQTRLREISYIATMAFIVTLIPFLVKNFR
jgi:hypothetical protein